MGGKRPSIYMDYQATTPVDERVMAAMVPYFTKHFGNASSAVHAMGWHAEEAVKQARARIANLLGASRPSEIIFTSGATESNNLAIFGVARRYRRKGNHIITVATEHKAILDPCKAWEAEGGRVTYLKVAPNGLVDLDQLEDSICDQTVLISVMHANNEIGVLQPIAGIGRMARAHGVLFHTDASQSAGKLPLDVNAMNIDLLSLSGHKIYGPKGIGVLYARHRQPRVSLMPVAYGGGHEGGRRSGTLNVPGIVGLAKALELCIEEGPQAQAALLEMRQSLWRGLQSELDGLILNGDEHHRLPANLNISIERLEIARLFSEIPHIAISSKSACSTQSGEPSHVLLALGRPPQLASSAIRFGLGRFSTMDEVDSVIPDLTAAIKKLRQSSTKYVSAQTQQIR